MFMLAFGDVNFHDVGSVLQIVEALRSRVHLPVSGPGLPEPSGIPAETPKLLPAPVGKLPAPVGEKSGEGVQDRAKVELEQRTNGTHGTDRTHDSEYVDRVQGRQEDAGRPVNVTVNVTANGGEKGRSRREGREPAFAEDYGAARGARKGSADGKALAAIHADVRTIKEVVPAAIERVEKGIETVQKHVRGVPILQAELAEARKVPEALALEIQRRIDDILLIDEQRIWKAVRSAGSQKGALGVLRKDGIVKSAATLCRRVGEIDAKLKKAGLPPCDASGPSVRFKKSGGTVNDEGKSLPEEVSRVARDWAEDPVERERTIRSYLAANDEEKEYFCQEYPGIDEEAEAYLKRHPMESD